MKRTIRRPKNNRVEQTRNRVQQSSMQQTNNSLIASITAQMKELKNLLTSSIRQPSRSQTQNAQLAAINAKYAELEKHLQALTAENDNYKKDIEYRKVAERKIAEEKHLANIDNRIKVMIANGIIASGDTAAIDNWKNLYRSDFNSTDALVKTQLSKLPAKQNVVYNNQLPTHQSVMEVAGEMAAKYLSSRDKSVFEQP